MCSHRSKDNRQTQAEFECVLCGHKEHADVVGAKNILERGHRLLVCGENEVTQLVGRSIASVQSRHTYIRVGEAGTRQISNGMEPALA